MADTVPPKKDGTRRRRNKPPVQPRNLKTGDRPKEVPPLLASLEWNDVERGYWETVWNSPMATQFIDADHPALIRLTRLASRAMQGDLGVAGMGELRQLEDRFGLSPLSRRRLQIEIEDLPGGQKPQEGRSSDDRFLRVIDGEG